jgi:peptidoglycan lytic transglycosylase
MTVRRTMTVVFVGCVASNMAMAQPRGFSGVAAYYSSDYSGRTACGERYDPKKYTAAHRSLPFGTRLRVTDPKSRRSVVVVVNDRGPFTRGRVLDLSLAAAKALRMMDRGLMKVTAVVE